MTELSLGQDQLSKRAVLQRVPLFAELPDSLLTVLLRRCDVVRPVAGTALLTEGGPVGSFYVLVTGAVALSLHGEEVSTLVAEGATIGLSSALREGPSPVTATAAGDTVLLRFRSNEFWSLVTGSAQLLRAVLSRLLTLVVEGSGHDNAWDVKVPEEGPVRTVQLALEEAEARSLRDLLDTSIGDMSMEIADTDNPNFRKELKSRRDQLQRVLGAIDTVIAP